MLKRNGISQAVLLCGLLVAVFLMIAGGRHIVMSASDRPLHCASHFLERSNYMKPSIERYLNRMKALDSIENTLTNKSGRYDDAMPLQLSSQFHAIKAERFWTELGFWRELSPFLIHADNQCDFERNLQKIARSGHIDLSLLVFEYHANIPMTHLIARDHLEAISSGLKQSSSRNLEILLQNYLDKISLFQI